MERSRAFSASSMQRDKDLKKLRADPAYAVVIAVIEQETAEKKP